MKQVKLKHKYKIACEHKNNIVIAKKKKKRDIPQYSQASIKKVRKGQRIYATPEITEPGINRSF